MELGVNVSVHGLRIRPSIAGPARGVACGVGFTVGLVLFLFLLVGEASAKAGEVNHRTITLHATVTPLPGQWFINSNRYVFISTGQGTGVVIDDQTGRRRRLPSGCGSASAIGGPWLVLGCAPAEPAEDLYNMATGQTTPFVPNPALEQPPISLCPVSDCGSGGIVRIGSEWAEIGLPSSDPEHILDRFAFQNLQTGEAVVNPTGGTTTVDLNSPVLAKKACRPLRVPTVRNPYNDHAPGTLTPIGGGFEIADANGSYLERCGTHLHQLLRSDILYPCAPPGCGPAGNSHLVVSGELQTRTGSFQIDGRFLPSRQRFRIPIPKDAAGIVGLAARHIYLGGGGSVWSTPIPKRPRTHRKKR